MSLQQAVFMSSVQSIWAEAVQVRKPQEYCDFGSDIMNDLLVNDTSPHAFCAVDENSTHTRSPSIVHLMPWSNFRKLRSSSTYYITNI